jgi:hypothetical protein
MLVEMQDIAVLHARLLNAELIYRIFKLGLRIADYFMCVAVLTRLHQPLQLLQPLQHPHVTIMAIVMDIQKIVGHVHRIVLARQGLHVKTANALLQLHLLHPRQVQLLAEI